MRASVFAVCAVSVAVMAAPRPAHATFTTVDLSSYVNTNPSIASSTYPTGISTGNTGTGVPFDVASFGANSYAGSWLAGGTGSSVTVALNVTGQASFYALLNNYYGTANALEYTITIATTGGSHSWNAIGGVDTRDYNNNVFTNTLAPTTLPWFDNGSGQRLDLREFDLPAGLVGSTVTGFTITQVDGRDDALFSGLTFSTEAAMVPEPGSLALLGSGLLALLVRRRRG